jgi:hypothetical protein
MRFFSKFDEFLKPPRYPKWHDVNLAAKVPGWKRFDAAEQWLQNHSLQENAANARAPEIRRDQFEEFLGARGSQNASLTNEQRERMFNELLEWARTRKQR